MEELQWRIKNNLELPPTRVFSPSNDEDRPIVTMSVASTPAKSPVKMSPLNEFMPLKKVRSRSVSDRKEPFAEQTSIETGAPPDVVQLRKHEISIINQTSISSNNQITVDNTRNNNENNDTPFGKVDVPTTEVKFVAKNSDDTRILTNASRLEMEINAKDQPICSASDNRIIPISNRKESKSGNIIQPSKLPRPTTIGSLKNPHLPATNNNIHLRTDRDQTDNLKLDKNKNLDAANLNEIDNTFDGSHHSMASKENRKLLTGKQNEKDSFSLPKQNDIQKREKTDVEKRSKSRKISNIEKEEDDNANLSDEGIIIGEINSNANSEASNSPLPPQSSNVDQMSIEENNCFKHGVQDSAQMNSKGAILEEDANCNNSLIDSKRNSDASNCNEGDKDHSKLSNQRKHSYTGVSNLNRSRNNNNNNSNVSNPQMSSPCDDRVPSRIPLSVE